MKKNKILFTELFIFLMKSFYICFLPFSFSLIFLYSYLYREASIRRKFRKRIIIYYKSIFIQRSTCLDSVVPQVGISRPFTRSLNNYCNTFPCIYISIILLYLFLIFLGFLNFLLIQYLYRIICQVESYLSAFRIIFIKRKENFWFIIFISGNLQ